MLTMLTPLRPRPHCVTRAPDSAPRKTSPLHYLTVTRGFRADISPTQMPGSTPGCGPHSGAAAPARWGPSYRLPRTGGNLRERDGTGRCRKEKQSHRAGRTRGRSGRVHRGGGRGGRGGSGVSTPTMRRETRAATAAARLTGTPPTSAHWQTEGVGRGRFRPISGRQRTANRRCATVSRATGPRLRQASPHLPTAWRILAMKAARRPDVAPGQRGPERGEGRRSFWKSPRPCPNFNCGVCTSRLGPNSEGGSPGFCVLEGP